MNDTYECSYVEVLEILKHIPKEEHDKIPKELIEFFEKNKYITPLVAAFVGLIPNCASSVLLVNMFTLN